MADEVGLAAAAPFSRLQEVVAVLLSREEKWEWE